MTLWVFFLPQLSRSRERGKKRLGGKEKEGGRGEKEGKRGERVVNFSTAHPTPHFVRTKVHSPKKKLKKREREGGGEKKGRKKGRGKKRRFDMEQLRTNYHHNRYDVA